MSRETSGCVMFMIPPLCATGKGLNNDDAGATQLKLYSTNLGNCVPTNVVDSVPKIKVSQGTTSWPELRRNLRVTAVAKISGFRMSFFDKSCFIEVTQAFHTGEAQQK